MRAAGIALALVVLAPAALAAEPPSKAPSPATKGKVHAWRSAGGQAYHYYVPSSYDPERGANLTVILHGSNLSKGWGFANHEAGTFRADDVVVSPDGTTANGEGGFNWDYGDKGPKGLHALLEEVRAALKIRSTFLYGHSQGAFFTLVYAKQYPQEVAGVLGQAGGVLTGVETPKGHHQAVLLMHGTADPVVPYSNSVYGLRALREARYPRARLRTLPGWNHWPAPEQADQALAWCEGMTADDPERVATLLDRLESVPEGQRDLGAWRDVAVRLRGMEKASAAVQRKAEQVVSAVDRVAQRHVESIQRSLGKEKGEKLVDAGWVAQLPTFLADFAGVEACDRLAKEWKDRIERNEGEAARRFGDYRRAAQKPDVPKAFQEGVEIVRSGFLHPECCFPPFLEQLEAWNKDAKKWKLSKAALKAYGETVPVYLSARKTGFADYAKVNRTTE